MTTRSGDGGTRRSTSATAGGSDDAGDEEADRLGVGPAGAPGLRRSVGEAVDEIATSAAGEYGAGAVNPLAESRRVGASSATPPADRHTGDHDVDVHRPAPVEVLREHAAEQQADRRPGGGDPAVDAERLSALLRVGEGRRQQRQRGRGEQCAERALHGTGGDEHPKQRARRRRPRPANPTTPAMNTRLRPKMSARRPPSSSRLPKASEYAVTIHWRSPLEKCQVALRVRQRDVHDRAVKHDHQLREREDPEDPPPPRMDADRPSRRCRGRCLRTGHTVPSI